MSTVTKGIALPDDLQAFAEERVQAGEYASVGEVTQEAFGSCSSVTDSAPRFVKNWPCSSRRWKPVTTSSQATTSSNKQCTQGR